jgi:hypothetical protein
MRRKFGFATISNFTLGFALYGSAYILPQYLAVASKAVRSLPELGCRSFWSSNLCRI